MELRTRHTHTNTVRLNTVPVGLFSTESCRFSSQLTFLCEVSVSGEQPADRVHHLPEERHILTHTHTQKDLHPQSDCSSAQTSTKSSFSPPFGSPAEQPMTAEHPRLTAGRADERSQSMGQAPPPHSRSCRQTDRCGIAILLQINPQFKVKL